MFHNVEGSGMHSARRGRQLSGLLVGIGVLVWALTAIGFAFGISEDEQEAVWWLIAGVVVGALLFLQLYIVAVVLRLLSDIATQLVVFVTPWAKFSVAAHEVGN